MRVLLVLAMLTLLSPAAAGAAAISGSAALSARPGATATTSYPVGLSRLEHDALLYRPASAPAGPAPVLVVLHGIGAITDDFLPRFKADADKRGFLLLALQSKEQTWDLVPKKRSGSGPMALKLKPRFHFGADVPRIDAVLTDFFAHAAVDPRRVVLLGFSDGASYALSLGLANPQLFRGIVAMSPGFVVIPGALDPKQRIFIAHATNDSILPFETTERDIVGLLRDSGLEPKFRPHKGDHHVDQAALEEGLDYVLGSGGSSG